MSYTVTSFIIWTTEKYYDTIQSYVGELDLDDVAIDIVIKDEETLELDLSDALIQNDGIPNLILVNDDDIMMYLENFPNTFSVFNDIINTEDFPRYKLYYLSDNLYNYPFSLGNQVLFYRTDLLSILPDGLTWNELINICNEIFENDEHKLLIKIDELIKILTEQTGIAFYDEGNNLSLSSINQVFNLINNLNNANLLYDNNDFCYEDEIIDGSFFALIGDYEKFTEIKKIVSDNSLPYEFGVIELPKTDTLQYNTSSGNYSFLAIETADVDIDLISDVLDCFKDGITIRNNAFEYDIVSAYSYQNHNRYDFLGNDECFITEDVVKRISMVDNIPFIYKNDEYLSLIDQYSTEILRLVNGTSSDIVHSNIINIFENNIDSNPYTLDYIEIVGTPITNYYIYERFDTTSFIVRAHFTNGIVRDVRNYQYNQNELTLSDHTITISYSSGGVTDSVTININVTNRTLVDLLVNYIGGKKFYQDELTNADFLVYGIYDYGDDRFLRNFNILPNTLSIVGENNITVNFEGINKNVNVLAYKKLNSISIITKPRKLSYYNGQRFNKGEMTVKAYYNDNSNEEITTYNINPIIVTFDDGNISSLVNISFTSNGITKSTSLKVYKNIGVASYDSWLSFDYIENGKVNLYDGSLKYEINDFISPNEILPVSISHLYIPNINSNSLYGIDFILNLEEQLIYNMNNYYYRDSLGDIYCFTKEDDDLYYSASLEAKLFIDGNLIIMKYKNQNEKTFSLISGIYRLIKVHIFPSNDNNVINTKSYQIVYDNNRIHEIKPINNNNFIISFTYTNNKLSSISYNSTTVASFLYQNNRLTKIIRKNLNTNLNKEIEFSYTNNSFTVIDKSSKDENDNYRHQTYEFTNNRLTRIKEGYLNEEIKLFSYYNDNNQDDVINENTVIRYKDMLEVYSFYDNTLVSSSSYKTLNNTDLSTIKAVYEKNSFGFDLNNFEDSYSDSLNLYSNNNVENSTSYTFGNISISNISDVVITFFIKCNNNTEIRINNEVFKKINTNGYYQFFAIPVRLENVLLSVNLSSISTFSVTRIKIIKKPYVSPELPTPVYDDNNNLCDYYSYNNITNNIVHTEIIYNEYNQMKEKRIKEGNSVVSLLKNYYNTRNEIELIESYGSSNNYTTSSYLYDQNGRIICENNSNIITSIEYGTNYKKITNNLDNNNRIEIKANYYNNSNVLSGLEVNNHQNGFIYNEEENIDEVCVDNNFYFNYSYNTYENLESINIGNESLVLIDSDDKHINLITYPNGLVKSYTYDGSDRLVEMTYENEGVLLDSFDITYSSDEAVTTISNNDYTYVLSRLNTNNITSRYEMLENNNQVFRIDSLALNINGNVNTKKYYFNNSLIDTLTITNDYYGKIISVTNQISNTDYIYNNLNQIEIKSNHLSNTLFMTNRYSYKGYGNSEYSNLIQEEKFERNNTILDSYTYTYYDNGNIKKVLHNNNNYVYYIYDNENRLSWEYNYSFNKAYNYTYDNKGNITYKKTYDLDSNGNVIYNTIITDSYNYETITPNSGQNPSWKDQLKSHNNSVISYDEYGNPTSYFNHNLSWIGRRLVSYDNISYTYDYNGIRLSKNNIKYYYENNSLKVETNGNYTIIYYYDTEGICGFRYNNEYYRYQKNQFGDIIGIYNDLGVLQIKYIYDSFGNHKIFDSNNNELLDNGLNIGSINPFRYRGYYYDRETNLYYLISRYYDAKLGRFISPDSIEYLDPESIYGYNLYAYCNNNPVMYSDGSGHMPQWLSCVLIAGTAVAAIALTIMTCGAAAAGAGALATMGAYSLGIGAAATTLSTIASAGVYVAAAASIIGVGAFAGAEIQQTFTGSNYMNWLGDSYGTVKNISYGIPFVLLGLSNYAPTPSTPSQTGAYIVKRGNTVVYVGKGSVTRMYTSMRNHLGTSCLYYPCSNEEMALANEAYFMQHYGGAQSMGGILENKINSPGLARLFEWF